MDVAAVERLRRVYRVIGAVFVGCGFLFLWLTGAPLQALLAFPLSAALGWLIAERYGVPSQRAEIVRQRTGSEAAGGQGLRGIFLVIIILALAWSAVRESLGAEAHGALVTNLFVLIGTAALFIARSPRLDPGDERE